MGQNSSFIFYMLCHVKTVPNYALKLAWVVPHPPVKEVFSLFIVSLLSNVMCISIFHPGPWNELNFMKHWDTMQQQQRRFYLQSCTHFQSFLHNVWLKPDLHSDHVVKVNRSEIFWPHDFWWKFVLKAVIPIDYISEASWMMTISYDQY